MKNVFYLILLISTFIFGCANKNERDFIKPSVSSDTDLKLTDSLITREISFKNDINPIIQGSCIDCHSVHSTNKNSPGDYFFDEYYTGFKKKVDELFPGTNVSKVEYRITSNDKNIRMPFMMDPLKPEQIQLIRTWIAQGAKNN